MKLRPKEEYPGDSKVERSVNYIKEHLRLALDTQGRPVAIIEGNNIFTKSLESGSFINEIRKIAFEHGDILKADDVKEVISNLSAIAEFEGGGVVDVYKRVAFSGNGVEIDSGNKSHTRYRLESGKVSVLHSDSDVIFERTDCMLPYPNYTSNGDIDLLKKYVRLTDTDFNLFVGWMCYTLTTPRHKYAAYVLLCLIGTMGSGKSFFCKEIIRSFTDPVNNPMSLFPKSPKDLAIASQGSHAQIIDNVRDFSKEWSDFFCSFATSGSIKERLLFSNGSEYILPVHSPLVMNGIHYFVKESDLASRCLTLHLPPMQEDTRRDEREIAADLEKDKPAIFSGLLQLSAKVLNEDSINDKVKHESRMMPFVKFLTGMEIVLELESGSLQLAYVNNIKKSMLEGLIEEPFAPAVIEFAKLYPASNLWVGTPSQLLAELSQGQSRAILNSAKVWPQNPIAQSKKLRVIEKALDEQGVELILGERGKERRISLGMQIGEAIDIEAGIDELQDDNVEEFDRDLPPEAYMSEEQAEAEFLAMEACRIETEGHSTVKRRAKPRRWATLDG